MPIRSYYDVLDVPRDASTVQIKASFRVLAMLWHPDHNRDANAPARFREISEAYQCLAHADSRLNYDNGLRRAEMRAEERAAAGRRACEEYPECVPCAFHELWAELREEFTVRPEQLIALFAAIERAIKRGMARASA
jgi:DnaJ-class molecular chaperone